MAAELVWYEADGVTPLARLEYGTIMPGRSYYELHAAYLKVILKNDGDLTANVVVAIQAVAENATHEYLRLATGVAVPGTFYGHAAPIDIGALAPAASAEFWVDVIVPAEAPFASIDSANLVATGS